MSSVMDIHDRQNDRQDKNPKWWSRLRSVLLSRDHGVENQSGGRDPLAVVTAPSLVPKTSSEARADGCAAVQLHEQGSAATGGVILPFPIHGEALLVKLAAVLRSRIADRSSEWDPLLLEMSRCPRSRLSIDSRAYIEFHQDCCEYRAVIEASRETKVILETVDFDALVDFVLPYVVARLAEPAALQVMP
jgi:hypothetical protein